MAMSKAMAKARAGLSRARHGARSFLGPRLKPALYAGGAGVAAQVVGEMAGDNIDFIKNRWYGEPAAIMAAGFLLLKKNHTLGAGLLGAGGYALAQNYKLNEFQQGKRSKSPIPTFAASSGGGSTGDADSGFLQA